MQVFHPVNLLDGVNDTMISYHKLYKSKLNVVNTADWWYMLDEILFLVIHVLRI